MEVHMEKCQVDDNGSSIDRISRGLTSSIDASKISDRNPKDAEVSTVSSERVESAQHTSIRSDVSSETGVSQGDKQLKTESSSSKESDEVLRLSSVDSTDPIPCQSSNENSANPTQSHESKNVLHKPESYCIFDLNEMDANGEVSEPIPVVAKVGIPIGLPQKPLEFCGELGWRRSKNTSAFRSTRFKNSDREKGRSCGNLKGFDLNIAAEEISVNDENHHNPRTLSFDLNDNPMIEDTRKNTATCSGGSLSQSIYDHRRPAYWVDLSNMRGFSHVQAQTFLVGSPTAEHPRMVVPIQSEIPFLPYTHSGFYIGKIPSFQPHLNNQGHAAYPGTLHLLGTPQGLNPNAYANYIRPTFVQNGSLALMGIGSRGASNAELLIPPRNALFEESMNSVQHVSLPALSIKRREPDGGCESYQPTYRQMASWN